MGGMAIWWMIYIFYVFGLFVAVFCIGDVLGGILLSSQPRPCVYLSEYVTNLLRSDGGCQHATGHGHVTYIALNCSSQLHFVYRPDTWNRPGPASVKLHCYNPHLSRSAEDQRRLLRVTRNATTTKWYYQGYPVNQFPRVAGYPQMREGGRANSELTLANLESQGCFTSDLDGEYQCQMFNSRNQLIFSTSIRTQYACSLRMWLDNNDFALCSQKPYLRLTSSGETWVAVEWSLYDGWQSTFRNGPLTLQLYHALDNIRNITVPMPTRPLEYGALLPLNITELLPGQMYMAKAWVTAEALTIIYLPTKPAVAGSGMRVKCSSRTVRVYTNTTVRCSIHGSPLPDIAMAKGDSGAVVRKVGVSTERVDLILSWQWTSRRSQTRRTCFTVSNSYGQIHRCIRKKFECPPPVGIVHGNVTVVKLGYRGDALAVHRCTDPDRYGLDGPAALVCNTTTLRWTGQQPACRPVAKPHAFLGQESGIRAVRVGTQLTVMCNATGTPPPSTEVLLFGKDSRQVTSLHAQSISLKVTATASQSAKQIDIMATDRSDLVYMVTCVARNRIGESRAWLEVYGS